MPTGAGSRHQSSSDPVNGYHVFLNVERAPNTLPFSCRARGELSSKTNDLARAAVSCNAGLGGTEFSVTARISRWGGTR
jgi:hypothetical protein